MKIKGTLSVALLLLAVIYVGYAQPISVVSHSSAFNSASTVTVSLPGGVQQNDFLLMHLSTRGATNYVVNAPAGWTRIRAISAGGSGGVIGIYYYKIAGAAEPSSYTFSDSNGTNLSDKLGIITAFRGVDTLSPIESEKGLALSGPPYSTANDTTTTDSCLIVTFFGTRGGSSSWTPPAGMSEVYDTSGVQSSRITACGDYVLQPMAGPTGVKTATGFTSGNVAAEIIALRPRSLITGITFSSQPLKDELLIYPNPVGEELIIGHWPLVINTIEIYNMLGAKVYAQQLQTSNLGHQTINVSFLSKGLYIITVVAGEKVYRNKFAKE